MIIKKQALSDRERTTEKILEAQLPEYKIRANMRLADIVHAREQFKFMSGYHLDFVVCDEDDNAIAAIELDDASHDNEDGKRKDKNKNKWLSQANIKLIRIREPEEALKIRSLIETQTIPNPSSFFEEKEKSLHEILSMKAASIPAIDVDQKRQVRDFSRKNKSIVGIIGFAIFMGLTMYIGVQMIFNNMGKNIVAQQQILQRENQLRTDNQKAMAANKKAEEEWYRQQENEKSAVRARIESTKTHTEKVVVKGRPLNECMNNSNVITDAVIRCTKTHFEWIEVSDNQ